MKLHAPRDPRELRPRILGLALAMLAGLFLLSINLYKLMVVRYEQFWELSQNNQYKDVRVRATRGEIRDRRGEVLVDVRPSFNVQVTPAFCQKCSVEVLPKLAAWLNWPPSELERVEQALQDSHGTQRYQPMTVAVDLGRDALDLLGARLRLLPGVDIDIVPHRSYRTGLSMAHLLGFMNEISPDELSKSAESVDAQRKPYAMGDFVGRRGVERVFETQLKGVDGWRQDVVNARGEVIRGGLAEVFQQPEIPARPGNHLVLTIDARLQEEAERVFPGEAGAIVALEAQTGFVRAMVSRPSFDPNQLTGRVSSAQMLQLSRDPLQPLVFRAAAQHYHPGSTFKPATLLAGFRSGAFGPNSAVNCLGGYRLGNRTWRCHKDSGHGPVLARDAVQKSCDTFFYRVADVVGLNPIAQEARQLGLGVATGFDVAAEVPGVIPDTHFYERLSAVGYTKGLALNAAIGQGDVNVTPLQLAIMYAAIANGGKVYRPQAVWRVLSPDGEVVQQMQPQVSSEAPLTEQEHAFLLDALSAVVNEPGGTAYRSRLQGVRLAGKTGTAQVARLGKTRKTKEETDFFERDHAWFAGFAPVEAPELVVVVLNEHGGHGGSDAAPAASALVAKYFELKAAEQAAGNGISAPAAETAALSLEVH